MVLSLIHYFAGAAIIIAAGAQVDNLTTSTLSPTEKSDAGPSCNPGSEFLHDDECKLCHCDLICSCSTSGCHETGQCKRCSRGYTDFPTCQSELPIPEISEDGINYYQPGEVIISISQSAVKRAYSGLADDDEYSIECESSSTGSLQLSIPVDDPLLTYATQTFTDTKFTPGVEYSCKVSLKIGATQDYSNPSQPFTIKTCTGVVYPSDNDIQVYQLLKEEDNSINLNISWPAIVDSCPESDVYISVDLTLRPDAGNIESRYQFDVKENFAVFAQLHDNRTFTLTLQLKENDVEIKVYSLAVNTASVSNGYVPKSAIRIVNNSPGLVVISLNTSLFVKGTFDVNEYIIEYRVDNTSASQTWTTIDVLPDSVDADINVPITRPGLSYEIRVKTKTEVTKGNSFASTSRSIFLRTVNCSFPGKPTDINSRFKERDKDKVELIVSFTDPSANCFGGLSYKIQYQKQASTLVQTAECIGESQCEIDGLLDPISNYTLLIIVRNDAGMESRSSYFYVSTPEKAPNSPSNVMIREIKGKRVTMVWNPPTVSTGPLQQYQVTVAPGESQDLPVTKTEYTFTGEWAQSYSFTVRAETSAGWGQQSPITNIAIPPTKPSRVRGLISMPSVGFCIMSTWKAPLFDGGIITGYNSSCRLVSTYQDDRVIHHRMVHTIHSAREKQNTICNLLAGSKYICQVVAYNSANQSDPVDSSPVWTYPAEPSEPAMPRIIPEDATDTTITLMLTRANKRDGPVEAYYIAVEKITPAKRSTNAMEVINNFESDPNRYITAKLIESDVGREFRIGNGGAYNGYLNRPLETGTKYKLHYGIEIKRGEKSTLKFFEVSDSVVVEKYTGPRANKSIILTAVIVVLAALVIIVVIVIAVFLVRKRHGGRFRRRPTLRAELIPLKQRRQGMRRPGAQSPESDSLTGCMGDIKPIKVADLRSFVTIGQDKMEQEYRTLAVGFVSSYSTSLEPENRSKNRFANILPYDHSRVKLQTENEGESDYINASYIDGYLRPRQYIAAQGPNQASTPDFWKMVWQQRITTIVMVTRCVELGKVKCERYWPDEQEEEIYGDIIVTSVNIETWADFTMNTFTVKKKDDDGSPLLVRHFHFLSWPDHGVVSHSTPFLLFRRKVKSISGSSNAPMLVHCSAGIGRSGTIIAIDYLLDQAHHEGQVNSYAFVQKMRTQRVNMVQTVDQYCYIYQAVCEALETEKFCFTAPEFQQQYSSWAEQEISETQYEVLGSLDYSYQGEERTFTAGEDNMSKNQDPYILPNDSNRVYLISQPKNYTSYINAVYLSSLRRRESFAVTQEPLPSTVDDYLRMIYDHKVSTVVSLEPNLSPASPLYKKLGVYLPENTDSPVETELFHVSLEEINDAQADISVSTITIKYKPSRSSQTFKRFQTNFWLESQTCPETTETFTTLMELVDKWQSVAQRIRSPICVQCRNGNERSGLFVCVWNALTRLKTEQEVDVFHTVELARIVRPQFIVNVEQYNFIYQVLNSYLQEFDLYANYK